MTEDTNQEKRLFGEALELPPAERVTFLRKACREDDALLGRVMDLLSVHSESSPVLRTHGETLADSQSLSEGPGTHIGRYKLLQKIGEGGMGVVYMAEQEEPVRRRVALKIIKLGMDTHQVVARFEAERQALALMDHPNIAKVLDAGATETGRPYFVMELVKGIPMTNYCDKKGLSTRDRLELFIPVCQAIQHAHQKGIIHRDIKPSNVLVALFDGRPLPMVIDFGVAKATNQRLTEKTLFTDFAQMIGTPAYMSPEQAEMSQLDVDTRSDVYSLGILLYELLTGETPFDDQQLRKAGWAGMQRIIAERDAPRPSNRFSTMTLDQQSEIGRNHREDPRHLSLLLKGDLDWIVMKALEKDRTQRYETANSLARDVSRYLTGDAPEAAPPTWRYLARKLARKHKKAVAVAAAFAAVLLATSAISTWQMIVAKRAQANADEQTAHAQAINDFLINDLLGQADNWMADTPPTPNLSVLDVVKRASRRVPERFDGQPRVKAYVSAVLGRVYAGLGQYQLAQENFATAHELFAAGGELTSPAALRNQTIWGWYQYFGGGRAEKTEALKKLRSAFELSLHTLGPSHEVTILCMAQYGSAPRPSDGENSRQYIEKALDLSSEHLGPEHPLTFEARRHFTLLRLAEGRFGEAQSHLLDLRRDWAEIAGTNNLRFALLNRLLAHTVGVFDRDLPRAERLLREGLSISSSLVGDAGYPTPEIYENLMEIQLLQHHNTEALEFGRRAVSGMAMRFGPNNPEVHLYLHRYLETLAELENWNEAQRTVESVLARGADSGYALAAELLLDSVLANERDSLELRRLHKRFWAQTQDSSTEALGPDVSPWNDHRFDPDETASYDNALVMLVLPNPDMDFTQPISLGTRALSRPGQFEWMWYRRPLLRGLLAYRQGDYHVATEFLDQLRASFGVRDSRLLATYFLAMSKARIGEPQVALSLLKEANETMDREVIVHERNRLPDPHYESWQTLPLCLLARREAEALILDQSVFEVRDLESLAERCREWKPVSRLLADADEAARRMDYAIAGETFLRAVGHEHFDLETAVSEYSWLPQGVAAALIKAGRQDDYFNWCQRLNERKAYHPATMHLQSLIMYPGTLPDELADIIEHSRVWGWSSDNLTENFESPFHREQLLWDYSVGLYRAGAHEEALKELSPLMNAYSYKIALGAKAYSALASAKLGRIKQAQKWLDEARTEYVEMLRAGKGKLEPDWHLQVAVDLAISEAQDLIVSPKQTND